MVGWKNTYMISKWLNLALEFNVVTIFMKFHNPIIIITEMSHFKVIYIRILLTWHVEIIYCIIYCATEACSQTPGALGNVSYSTIPRQSHQNGGKRGDCGNQQHVCCGCASPVNSRAWGASSAVRPCGTMYQRIAPSSRRWPTLMYGYVHFEPSRSLSLVLSTLRLISWCWNVICVEMSLIGLRVSILMLQMQIDPIDQITMTSPLPFDRPRQ